jgi:hypothetical protein
MEQTSIIRNLARWLTANLWHESLTVLYDLCSYGVPGESQRGALYTGEKERGRGRRTQLVQADILVRREDTMTVELVVEVDFRKTKSGDLVAPRPKDLTGLLLAPAAADCHTPSNEYRRRYKLRDTIILVVSAYATAQQLQDDQAFADELFRRFHVAECGVREFCICGGATQEEVEGCCEKLLRSRFRTATSLRTAEE